MPEQVYQKSRMPVLYEQVITPHSSANRTKTTPKLVQLLPKEQAEQLTFADHRERDRFVRNQRMEYKEKVTLCFIQMVGNLELYSVHREPVGK